MPNRTYIEFSNPVSVKTTRTLPMVSKQMSMNILFTDNSKVCYKPHSLSVGGVGTVRNSRSKSYRT